MQITWWPNLVALGVTALGLITVYWALNRRSRPEEQELWTPEREAEEFRVFYQMVFQRSAGARLTREEEYWVEDAMDQYWLMDCRTRALLAAEKRALDSLYHQSSAC